MGQEQEQERKWEREFVQKGAWAETRSLLVQILFTNISRDDFGPG